MSTPLREKNLATWMLSNTLFEGKEIQKAPSHVAFNVSQFLGIKPALRDLQAIQRNTKIQQQQQRLEESLQKAALLHVFFLSELLKQAGFPQEDGKQTGSEIELIEKITQLLRSSEEREKQLGNKLLENCIKGGFPTIVFSIINRALEDNFIQQLRPNFKQIFCYIIINNKADYLRLLLEKELFFSDHLLVDGFKMAAAGHPDCFKVLLDNNRVLSKIQSWIWISAFENAANGHPDCLKLLINKSDVCTPERLGKAAIKAAQGGHSNCIKVLFERSEIRDKIGFNGLGQAFVEAAIGGHDACIQAILDQVLVNQISHDYIKRAVHKASRRGHAKCLEKLFANSYINDHVEINLGSAIGKAASEGHAGCLKILLNKIYNADGIGTVHLEEDFTAAAVHVDCLKLFLLRDDLMRKLLEFEGSTGIFRAFQNAAGGGHADCLRLLLAREDFLSKLDNDRWGRLFLGASIQKDCLKALMEQEGILDRLPDEFIENAFCAVANQGRNDSLQLMLNNQAFTQRLSDVNWGQALIYIAEGYRARCNPARYNICYRNCLETLLGQEGVLARISTEALTEALNFAVYLDLDRFLILLGSGESVNRISVEELGTMILTAARHHENGLQTLLDNQAIKEKIKSSEPLKEMLWNSLQGEHRTILFNNTEVLNSLKRGNIRRTISIYCIQALLHLSDLFARLRESISRRFQWRNRS